MSSGPAHGPKPYAVELALLAAVLPIVGPGLVIALWRVGVILWHALARWGWR